jgi:hypothetical protein
MPRIALDEIGNTYHRLTVRERATRPSHSSSATYPKYAWWRCDCVCGGSKVVRGDLLRRGMTRSCGCLTGDVIRARHAARMAEQAAG